MTQRGHEEPNTLLTRDRGGDQPAVEDDIIPINYASNKEAQDTAHLGAETGTKTSAFALHNEYEPISVQSVSPPCNIPKKQSKLKNYTWNKSRSSLSFRRECPPIFLVIP